VMSPQRSTLRSRRLQKSGRRLPCATARMYRVSSCGSVANTTEYGRSQNASCMDYGAVGLLHLDATSARGVFHTIDGFAESFEEDGSYVGRCLRYQLAMPRKSRIAPWLEDDHSSCGVART
jgi:hypothetical protein